MKILIISPYFYPHPGGSQQYMAELHATLISHHPDIQVDVIAYNTDNAPEIELYRGMTVYRIPCFEILRGQFAIPDYFKLWKLIKKLHAEKKYDSINANTRFFESAWWTPWVAKRFKTTSILTDHCADHPTHGNTLISSIARLLDSSIVPLFVRRFDRIIATNQSTKQFLTKMGLPNVQVIYGGVDISTFKPSERAEIRHIEGIDKQFGHNDILVAFIGRMIYSKGPQLLFDIAQKLTAHYPHLTFVFAGDGEMYEKLRHANEKNIYFLGKQNKAQIARLLKDTDILVHPSLHHEGFPNVLLEAGAAGCAIVATDQGGTKEIVINEKTGLLVKPDQQSIHRAIEQLIKDEKTRNTYRKAIREHIESHFDWNSIAKDYASFLQQSNN